MSHTPGPWFTTREGFSTVYVEARIGGNTIQEVAACGPTASGSEQQEANARLIAAAPDLLEALTLMCRSRGSSNPIPAPEHYEAAYAAIAKATQ